MFGFLKKKLQDAVSRFSKKAKEEVVEEKVDDERLLEAAKQEERQLLKKEEAVEEIPETPAERAQHDRERARKAAAKSPEKEEPKVTPPAAAKPASKPAKPAPKQETKPSATPAPTKPIPKPTRKPGESPRQAERKEKREEKRPPEGPAPAKQAVSQERDAASQRPSLPKKQVAAGRVAITYYVHGTTTDNEAHLASGHHDVDLSGLGVTQAKELRAKARYAPDVVYCSDLKPAIRSAELTWSDEAEIIADARLRECDYGELTRRPQEELEEWAAKHDIIREGYPAGESLRDVEERMRSFLNDLAAKHEGEHVAIVAHKATQFAMEVLLEGKTWEEAIASDWRRKRAWKPGWEFTLEGPLPSATDEEEQRPSEGPAPALEQQPAEAAPKGGFLKKLFGKRPKEEPEPATKPVPVKEREATTPAAAPTDGDRSEADREEAEGNGAEGSARTPAEPPKRRLLDRLKESFTKKTLSEEKFEELFWDLEVAMLENNVALEVIEKLKSDLKRALTSGKVSRLGIEDLILVSLKESVTSVLDIPGFDLVERIKRAEKRPFIIAFIGVNGSGKTTTLAKIANLFQEEGLSVVLAASDTFRAAAIDQLQEHAEKLGVKMVSQGYGADPAAVAYDAIEHAKAKGIDVVMVDTAGRLHSNTNLMAELEKVVRVAKPDLKIFIGESVTGNDCVEQAKEFDRLVGIDAIILSKADVDEKGGAALSVSYVTKRPILYLGVGQAYGDLKRFDKEEIIRGLGLS